MTEAHRDVAAVEAPTLILGVAVYGAWLGLTSRYGHWPLWIVAPATAVVLAFHSSLQHEILHGHPTRWRRVNRWFGMAPLSLWLPYDRYCQDHLVHHINDRLTDPYDDPESCYLTPEDWARRGAFTRARLRIQQTLAGRILVAPFWLIAGFLVSDMRAILRRQAGRLRIWLEHLAWCVPVILWLVLVCNMPMWIYVFAMVIPGYAIILVRSFAEHRARAAVPERTAIVEASWILGPIYLFNNLHAMHHEDPALPWYRYLARYRVVRERLVAGNGSLVYRSYFEVARRYLFWPHDAIVHPLGRAPLRPAGDSPPHALRDPDRAGPGSGPP
jgi:fatty acid desaturase